MMMADTISNRVFLDSDDVNKLDSILDVTSRDTDSHPLLEQMFQIAFIVLQTQGQGLMGLQTLTTEFPKL